jgi:hypothetical protein
MHLGPDRNRRHPFQVLLSHALKTIAAMMLIFQLSFTEANGPLNLVETEKRIIDPSIVTTIDASCNSQGIAMTMFAIDIRVVLSFFCINSLDYLFKHVTATTTCHREAVG